MNLEIKGTPPEADSAPAADKGSFVERVARHPLAKTARVFVRTRSRRELIIGGAVAILVLAGAGYWLMRGAGGTSEALIVNVERGNVEDSVTALGNLQPRDYVDVGAQVSGQLKKIVVDVGATVKAGDMLAEIDPAVLNTKVQAGRAQLDNLKAQLRDREAQLELARGQFQRQQLLKNANATSTEEYQTAQSGMRSAQAQVAAVKAQIEQTSSTLRGDEVTLGYTKIYAPMAGTVVSLTARQGQTLNANQQAPVILRVADLSTMTVWTQVSEADVPKLKIGMDAYFTILGSPGRRWEGKLRQILPTPEVVNNVVLYTALFDVDNPGNALMTQMTAQVFFVIAKKDDVITVPMAALRRYRPRQQLYKATVVTPSGAHEEREVKIGVSNRVTAEVVSGLTEGERVIAGTQSTAPRERTGNGGPGSRQGGGARMRGFP